MGYFVPPYQNDPPNISARVADFGPAVLLDQLGAQSQQLQLPAQSLPATGCVACGLFVLSTGGAIDMRVALVADGVALTAFGGMPIKREGLAVLEYTMLRVGPEDVFVTIRGIVSDGYVTDVVCDFYGGSLPTWNNPLSFGLEVVQHTAGQALCLGGYIY